MVSGNTSLMASLVSLHHGSMLSAQLFWHSHLWDHLWARSRNKPSFIPYFGGERLLMLDKFHDLIQSVAPQWAVSAQLSRGGAVAAISKADQGHLKLVLLPNALCNVTVPGIALCPQGAIAQEKCSNTLLMHPYSSPMPVKVSMNKLTNELMLSQGKCCKYTPTVWLLKKKVMRLIDCGTRRKQVWKVNTEAYCKWQSQGNWNIWYWIFSC